MFQDTVTRLRKSFDEEFFEQYVDTAMQERVAVRNVKILNLINDIDLEKIRVTEYRVKIMNASTNFDFVAGIDSVEDTLRESKDILRREIETAVTINNEFAYPAFLNRLNQAARRNGVFTIDVLDNGQAQIIPHINEIFGSLDEYADAVTATRRENRENSNIPDALRNYFPSAALASHFWEEKFYQVAREGRELKDSKGNRNIDKERRYKAKYVATIKSRLSKCTNPAPFWELLDRGVIGMKSDLGGGTAYPVNVATNFVENTLVAMKKYYTDLTTRNKIELGQSLDRENRELSAYTEWLDTKQAGLRNLIKSKEEVISSEVAKIGEQIVLKGKSFSEESARTIVEAIAEGKETGAKSGNRVTIDGVRIRLTKKAKIIQKALAR